MDPTLAGGERGIRTLDRVTPIPVFETGAFNHSATSPEDLVLRHKRVFCCDVSSEGLAYNPVIGWAQDVYTACVGIPGDLTAGSPIQRLAQTPK